MKLRFLLWLGLMALVGLVAWQGFARPGAVQTDLLALLPRTEANPRAEEAAAALARQGERRSIFLVGGPERHAARRAAEAFHAALSERQAYAGLRFRLPALAFDRLIAELLPYRFGLLTDADADALRTGDTASFRERLTRRLVSPLATGLATPLAHDPYATLSAWLQSRPWSAGRLRLDDGMLVASEPGHYYVLITGELKGSAFDDEVQQSVAAAVGAAETAMHRAVPEAQLLRLGAVHYGAAARAQAEWEVSVIGLGSSLGIAVLMLAVFRSLRPLVLSYLPVVAGIGAGAAACVAVFGQVHLLTLVFGASLIGGAVDYSLHYFVAQLEDGPAWQPEAGLRRILPGIGLGLVAAVLGYGGLLFAPFSVLKQIALYSTAGLVAAWLTTVLALPALLAKAGRSGGERLLTAPLRALNAIEPYLAGARLWLLFAALVALCLPGLWLLRANDDIHLLVSPPPALKAQELSIRTLAGGGAGSQFFLVEGASAEEVLSREETLRRGLDRLKNAGRLSDYSALSRFVPSAARQADNRALARSLYGDAGLAGLAELGFAPRVLADLKSELAREQPPLTPAIWLASPYAEGQRHLWLGEKDGRYASIVLPGHYADAAELAALSEAGVSFVDKAGSVSRLFTAYRINASWLVLAAFTAVLLLLLWRYGLRFGVLAMLPSLVAVACALAVLGYAGLPLTLFNVIALMLVLGIGIDYAIFMLEGGEHEAATLFAVSLSALTTVLSFGLLALSATPALRTFGLSVLIGISVAHTLTPLLRGRRSS